MRWTIEPHETVDSTNTVALAALKHGAPEGTVVVAARQTAGRGRLQRAWYSDSAENLYLSIVLRPDCRPEALGPFALVVGLGVMEGLEEIAAGLNIRIKWPNDLYVKNRKIAGILVETVLSGAKIDGIVVGIGLNVNCAAEDFPPELRDSATSLALATGCNWSLPAVRDAVLQGVANAYDHWRRHGFASLRPVYDVRSYLDGRHVRVTAADGTQRRGIVRGVTLAGALQVVDPSDAVHEILEGDLELES